MIYNRYNPCNLVCVFYNCTISFEGLSYPIHILIITRWCLCRLLEHEAGHCRPAASRASTDSYEQECSFKLLQDQNFNVACKRGIRYPSYEVMYCQEKMSLRLSVSISHGYTIVILCIYLAYFDFSWSVGFQADLQVGTGAVRLDLELLKPLRVSAVAPERIERSAPADSIWLEYAYRKHRPALQYLPTKLAE